MKKCLTIFMMLGSIALNPHLSGTPSASAQPQPATFTVRIENVSDGNTLSTDQGRFAVPLAPGVWAVHLAGRPLFTASEPDYGEGLEALAEDGNPAQLGAALFNRVEVLASRVFNTPVDAAAPGPLGPGDVYEFSFSASPGTQLSLATMFVHSNDLFYATFDTGLDLFDRLGNPISDDLTAHFRLWDAGTEANQAPGLGADQAPRQAGPNTGAPDPDNQVRLASDRYSYPDVEDVIRVTLTPSPRRTGCLGRARYQVRFDGAWSLQTHPNDFPPNPHFSGLIGATHNDEVTIWAPGELATPGIENMAETGSKTPLTEEIEAATQSGVVGNLISGGGINPPPGSVSVDFDIDAAHPLVSLVSMVAPSPDWFVGVYDLSLCEDGQWVVQQVIEMLPWDAGTDSGLIFTSANVDTDPHEPIARIEDPFRVGGRVPSLGTFTFTRLTPAPLSAVQAVAAWSPNDPAGASADRIVGDLEMLQAVSWWAQDTAVPGSGGQRLDDDQMRQVVQSWVQGVPIS